MATDRDEQLRQQQELEEIRRSFAEMGARMGSLFEPVEADEAEQARPPTQPAASASPASPAFPLPAGFQARPRWWWAGALVLLFVAGTAFGWILPKDDGDPGPPVAQTTLTTTAASAEPQTTAAPPPARVAQVCVDAAELADEVIAKLNRNERDNRLGLLLRDWSTANQACRREASP